MDESGNIILSKLTQEQKIKHHVFSLIETEFTLLYRQECSGTVRAYCNLELLSSGDPPASASQVTRTTGTCHHIWPS
ncbi:hypothetical protein AAY473_033954, partial [Plecturocebus cupreus]